MRVVKFTWNQKVNADANYSVQAELVVDDHADAEQIGRDCLAFVDGFQVGMKSGAAES